MPEFKTNPKIGAGTGITVRKEPIPSNKGFFNGSKSQYKKYALDTQSKEGSPAELLNAIALSPEGMTRDEIDKVVASVGMRGASGYPLKNKVNFLLKKFAEKQPDGRWKVTKEIKPPFFSESTQMPKMTEVFSIDD